MLTSQNSNLIQVTSGTCSLDLRNIDVGWYGAANYVATKNGYTPIAWTLAVANFAGLTHLQVESASVSSGRLDLTMYGSPFANQARVNHTVTVRVVWLKDR